MELITGGAYQGKLTYAVNKYGFDNDSCFDLSKGWPEAEYPCFYHLESLTRCASKQGVSSDEILKRLYPFIKNSVVISREIGCGIVPMDPSERLYREIHGSLLKALAKSALSVTRIFCGLPEVLK